MKIQMYKTPNGDWKVPFQTQWNSNDSFILELPSVTYHVLCLTVFGIKFYTTQKHSPAATMIGKLIGDIDDKTGV